MNPTAFLTDADVRARLSYADLIPAMERTLIDFSAGRVVQPVRTTIPIPESAGVLGMMPAIYGEIMGVKLLTYNLENAARGLPVYFTSLHLFRAATGEPLAVMDATAITEMRTAAVSAVAARRLARADAPVLAVLGTGVQARAHVEALRHVRSIAEVRVWGRTPAHAERCARDVGGRVMAADAAVRGAQLVVTATGTAEPVLRGAWLDDGACVITIGGYGRTRRELDDGAMRGTVIVDSRAAALEESGDVIQSGAPIAAEIGEVLAGSKALPASHHVVFKSNGLAAEDVAAGELVWRATASP